nr:autotransporter outer membrane beta-barrel domain-containing protein [Rhodopirellula sp. SWK7]
MQYVYARQNAFTETGAGAMNLAMSGVDTHSLRSNLGSRLQWQSWTSQRGWEITPEIRGSWMHEFLDTTSIVNAQFAGVGGAGFSANGLDLGRDWAIVGRGFSASPSARWELRADYDTQFNDDPSAPHRLRHGELRLVVDSLLSAKSFQAKPCSRDQSDSRRANQDQG